VGTYTTDDSATNGEVVQQSPGAGTLVALGSAVTLNRYVPNHCGPNPC
jgi:beta-lactam-binding protein with PASTA domain